MKRILLVGMSALLLMLAQAFIQPIIVKAFSEVENKTFSSVQSFHDISGHWAETNIMQAIKKGYVDGYPGGNFFPNKNVSRAEFVKMAVSALQLEAPDSTGKWYEAYIGAAEAAGLYKPGDLGDSNWTKTLTREEMSKIAVRALGIAQVEEKQWMYIATKNGIMSGKASGEIDPKGSTTRAQAITVIERLLSVKKGEKLAVDKYAVAAAEMYWHKTNIFTVAAEIFNAPENEKYTSAKLGIRSWSEDKLTVSSPDRSIVGRVNRLTAIDWNDPKDPNRKLLPSKDKLVLQIGGKQKKFTDDMQVYVLVWDSQMVINKKPKSYPMNRLNLIVHGYSGIRNGIDRGTPFFDSSRNIYGLVIPKENFHTSGELRISIETISLGAPLYTSRLSTSVLTR